MPTEAKPFASLSSGLLARKGAARPAMRPQGFGQVGNGLEDLGWNDMGFEPPKAAEAPRDEDHDAFGDDVVEHPRVHPTGLTPVGSPVHDQQAEIVERFSAADEPESARPEEADEPQYEADESPKPMSRNSKKPTRSSSSKNRRRRGACTFAGARSRATRPPPSRSSWHRIVCAGSAHVRRVRARHQEPRPRRRLRSASIPIVISS